MSTELELAVECRAVKKSYPTSAQPVPALRGIDLEVRRGEFLMLVGPSGCGKTTLISIVAGILGYDAGSCRVFGQDWSAATPRERASLRATQIGFVFQQYHLIPTLTLLDNVSVPLLIGGVGRAEARQRALQALEWVGLGGRSADLPRALSGGQQQRVAIARALVHEPKLIVCDEPTSALDHQTGQQVLELLRGLAQSQRRTLLVVTHDSRIFHYADRIAEMDDGRIQHIKENSPREDTFRA
ncbi:MAG: ABC transporter ATP-binding protein [Bryobacteraceae bacterium]|nr:ABC transporter ATP-binding protein [Bryobacteraceae bacterium]